MFTIICLNSAASFNLLVALSSFLLPEKTGRVVKKRKSETMIDFYQLPLGVILQFEKCGQYYGVVKAVNIVTALKLLDGSGYPAEDCVRGFVAE